MDGHGRMDEFMDEKMQKKSYSGISLRFGTGGLQGITRIRFRINNGYRIRTPDRNFENFQENWPGWPDMVTG